MWILTERQYKIWCAKSRNYQDEFAIFLPDAKRLIYGGYFGDFIS